MTDSARETAAGIEALIERLTREGVEAGRAEAERIAAEAERRAAATLAAAEREAEETRTKARAEADRLRRGGEEALRVAMRDAVLELKTRLSEGFAREVRAAVGEMTRDDAVLRGMILAVAGRAREEAGLDAAEAVEIALPRSVVALEDLRRAPEALAEGTLTHFVASVAADLLREGVDFAVSEDEAGGIRLRLEGSEVVVDLTDAAVAEVILRHLQPRFRALLEGVVR